MYELHISYFMISLKKEGSLELNLPQQAIIKKGIGWDVGLLKWSCWF